MNRTCKGKKKSGEPCRAVAGANGLCNLHGNPARAAELGRKSGRSRRYVLPLEKTDPELAPPQTAQQVRDVLGQAISDVRGRRLDPKVASTMGYLASVLLKSIEVSDVEQRLATMESLVSGQATTDLEEG